MSWLSGFLDGLVGGRALGRSRLRWLRGEVGRRETWALAQLCGPLVRHGLFDPAWYLEINKDVSASGMDALLHFLRSGWAEGRDPGPGFSVNFYRQHHADVAAAKADPLRHFLRWGRKESRRTLPARPQHALSDAPWPPPLPSAEQAIALLAEKRQRQNWPRLASGDRVDVFVHARGNVFMTDIARLVAAGATAAGFRAQLRDESAWPGEAALRLVVAPHEFFFLPTAAGSLLPATDAAKAVLLNVEQLHTNWFQQGAEALKHAGHILDISLLSAAQLASVGLPAQFLPLGYVPGYPDPPLGALPQLPALATLEPAIRLHCPPPGAPLCDRPIDILFIGTLSARRAGILGRMASRLTRWRCHFFLVDDEGPLVEDGNAPLDGRSALGLAARAKIVLNLHQTDVPFFEWHRVVLQGLWQRSLVVSEPTAAPGALVAGRDFLAAPLEELPDLLDWLLGSAAGQAAAERVRTQGFYRLSTELRMDRTLSGLFSGDAR